MARGCSQSEREMALLMVGYLIGKFGVERNGPDGQFSASCPSRLTRCATRIWQLVPKRISGDFYWGDDAKYEPVTPDRIVSDGERVEIGGVSLTAHLTPGHTKGCTSWSMRVHEDGKNYDVLFQRGLTVSPYKLTNDDKYPKSFKTSAARYNGWAACMPMFCLRLTASISIWKARSRGRKRALQIPL